MNIVDKPVGTLEFDNRKLDIYVSLDEPIFRASDIATMIDYSDGNVWNMLNMCEEDEKLTLPMIVTGQKRIVTFITETGLYNILSQSRKPFARKWRRVIHEELIRLRKSCKYNIVEQFDYWNQMADNIYFDEATGMLMESVTIAGGDVIQVPYVSKQNN